MGWPRKNEGYRLYLERKDKSYIMVALANGRATDGCLEAIANVHPDSHPCLMTTGVYDAYLRNACRRVEWSELPKEWQAAFLMKLDDLPVNIRGFWRTSPKKPPNAWAALCKLAGG